MARTKQGSTRERGTVSARFDSRPATVNPALAALVRLLAQQAAREALAAPVIVQENNGNDEEV
jgi:hypothetical protein